MLTLAYRVTSFPEIALVRNASQIAHARVVPRQTLLQGRPGVTTQLWLLTPASRPRTGRRAGVHPHRNLLLCDPDRTRLGLVPRVEGGVSLDDRIDGLCTRGPALLDFVLRQRYNCIPGTHAVLL